eukprot:m.742854 g.742854  ORF g.742854 m.742854 type:complete len:53 (-) comp23121_c1_seq15:3637-3795(-)
MAMHQATTQKIPIVVSIAPSDAARVKESVEEDDDCITKVSLPYSLRLYSCNS